MGVTGLKGWGMTGSRSAAYSAELVAELYQGKRVARTWRSGEGSEGFGGMFQTFKPDAYVGKRVRFSAALRTVDVKGRAALCFRVDGPNGRRAIAFDNMSTRPAISGTTPWTKH